MRKPGHREAKQPARVLHVLSGKATIHNLNPSRLSVGGGFVLSTLQLPEGSTSVSCCTIQQPIGRGEAYIST